MKYKMKLKNTPFNSIKDGTKTIELRLNDEKRQALKINDTIEFTNIVTSEILLVKIENIYKYDNFEELYKHFDKVKLGYKENEIANPRDMLKYYSKEEQDRYGVLGIKIRKIWR